MRVSRANACPTLARRASRERSRGSATRLVCRPSPPRRHCSSHPCPAWWASCRCTIPAAHPHARVHCARGGGLLLGDGVLPRQACLDATQRGASRLLPVCLCDGRLPPARSGPGRADPARGWGPAAHGQRLWRPGHVPHASRGARAHHGLTRGANGGDFTRLARGECWDCVARAVGARRLARPRGVDSGGCAHRHPPQSRSGSWRCCRTRARRGCARRSSCCLGPWAAGDAHAHDRFGAGPR